MPTLHILPHGSLRCAPETGPRSRDIIIISSFSNLYLKETEASQYLPESSLHAHVSACEEYHKLHGTHNLLLPLATSFSYLGVFQMGERYEPYDGYYSLFHLPDQMLFPILAPSHSADFVVSSSVMASSLSPKNSTSMSSFF